jgi:ABC-type uncharacterized transport system ATPase component
MLELNHIHKLYNPGTVNEICLFDDFNLKIDDGQFVSVVMAPERHLCSTSSAVLSLLTVAA